MEVAVQNEHPAWRASLRELQAAYRQGWSEWFTWKPRGLTKEQAAMNKASELALAGRG
jgi:hypothetical protein